MEAEPPESKSSQQPAKRSRDWRDHPEWFLVGPQFKRAILGAAALGAIEQIPEPWDGELVLLVTWGSLIGLAVRVLRQKSACGGDQMPESFGRFVLGLGVVAVFVGSSLGSFLDLLGWTVVGYVVGDTFLWLDKHVLGRGKGEGKPGAGA